LEPSQKDQSVDLVRIVAVLYGVVLGQALFNKPTVLLHPLASGNQLPVLALGVVFSAAIWEFLSYSLYLGRFPYDVRWVKGRHTNTASEEGRFSVDVVVALGFGILLLVALDFQGNGSANLTTFLIVLSVVYALIFLSDDLRTRRWDVPWVRGVWPFIVGLFPLVLLLAYICAGRWGAEGHRRVRTNLIFLAIAFVFVHIRGLVDRSASKRGFESHEASEERPRLGPGEFVYLAGPSGFTEAGRDYHREKVIRAVLNAGFNVLDPWTNQPPDELSPSDQNQWVAEQNIFMMNKCSRILAILDGSDVDSGTAAEIGYGYAIHKYIVGLRTDTRMTGDNPSAVVNLQIEWMIRPNGTITSTLPMAVQALKNA
jgi:nucleoside 2-deoxyribosyltransferase